MIKKLVVSFLTALLLVTVCFAQGQAARVYRVGVIYEGGPLRLAIDGLKDGLRDLGFEAGKQYILEIRDLNGDRRAAAEAGRTLEQGKVDLIYVQSTSVVTTVKEATSKVPIVFAVGTDPVVAGLVNSFARPGGRLTGVHFLSADLTGKRLEILKEVLPGARRVVTFYDPNNESALVGAKLARTAASQLNVEIIERRVASVEELRAGVKALKPQEMDAYFYINDAMVVSQAQFIIDAAASTKLPTMFGEGSNVAQGALASYGVNYCDVGQLAAKYVKRILAGAKPQDLPVESISRLGLALNLKTARELGLTIPQAVVLRADKVIE